jgi:phosphate-selective porin
VTSRAWYASALYMLTGEDEVSDTSVKPLRPLGCGGPGAWEVGLRYDNFRTNRAPFDAGLVHGTPEVKAWTVGINWYPTVHIRFWANIFRADFKGPLRVGERLFDEETAYLIAGQYYY